MCGICSRLGVNIHDDGGAPVRLAGELLDAAKFNSSGFTWATKVGLQTHVSDLVGTTVRGNPVYSHGPNQPGTVSWQIDSGYTLNVGTDGIITYGFFDGKHAVGLNNNKSFGEGAGYSPFDLAQKAAARIAIQNWDDLIAPDFQEVTGPGASEVSKTDILLANTVTGPAQAWAYYGGYDRQYKNVSGDVWIHTPKSNASNGQLLPGQYGLLTLNHELGHSLGLSHPGTYNFSDDNDGDGQPDPITYEGDAQYFQDSMQFSIMSYFDAYETGAQNVDWNVMRFVYASTPMVDDVYVVQQKYGAETTTRTGDTTYGFNSSKEVTNEAMKFNKGEMFTIFTIWDSAGKDTLNLSGYHTDSIIDLREGAFSSAGGYGAYDPGLVGTTPTLLTINANNTAAFLGPRTAALFETYFNGTKGTNEGLSWKAITGTGEQLLMEQNIGIAYGAVIENAIGGFGDDRINGNQENNFFTGGAGADTFVFANYSTKTAPDPTTATGLKEIKDTSTDTIIDFVSGTDKIDVSWYDAGAAAGDQAFVFIGAGSFTGVAGQLRYAKGVVQGDANGDGLADFSINIANNAALTAADFIL
jgi:serralysin